MISAGYRKSWGSTSPAGRGLVLVVETDDLAERLLTLAGTIMEDVAPRAIIIGDIDERISAVRAAGRDIAVLAEAARIVSERG